MHETADKPAEERPSRVFISYAHSDLNDRPDPHAELVRDFWIFLRSHGIDARLDRPAAERRQDWPSWMGEQVREADHVIIVASPEYRLRAEGRTATDEGRGVQWEARLIRDALYENPQDLNRFIPVVLPGQSVTGIPHFMSPASVTFYTINEFTVKGAESLLRLLLRQPFQLDPPLGPCPSLPAADTTLSSALAVEAQWASRDEPEKRETALLHALKIHLHCDELGVRTRTELAGTLLGERVGSLPESLASGSLLEPEQGDTDAAARIGGQLWATFFDAATGKRLLELINARPIGATITISVEASDTAGWIPVELLRLPDRRSALWEAGVRFVRQPTARSASVRHTAAPPPRLNLHAPMISIPYGGKRRSWLIWEPGFDAQSTCRRDYTLRSILTIVYLILPLLILRLGIYLTWQRPAELRSQKVENIKYFGITFVTSEEQIRQNETAATISIVVGTIALVIAFIGICASVLSGIKWPNQLIFFLWIHRSGAKRHSIRTADLCGRRGGTQDLVHASSMLYVALDSGKRVDGRMSEAAEQVHRSTWAILNWVKDNPGLAVAEDLHRLSTQHAQTALAIRRWVSAELQERNIIRGESESTRESARSRMLQALQLHSARLHFEVHSIMRQGLHPGHHDSDVDLKQ